MKLKNKPSDVLEQALGELEKCEANPDIIIDMSDWVYPHDDKCTVCLAGVLMVMGQDIKDLHEPQSPVHNFPAEAHKLHAVDAFRAGRIWAGIEGFNNPSYRMLTQPPKIDGISQYFPMPDYSDDPTDFKTGIKEIIEMLRSIGQ